MAKLPNGQTAPAIDLLGDVTAKLPQNVMSITAPACEGAPVPGRERLPLHQPDGPGHLSGGNDPAVVAKLVPAVNARPFAASRRFG